MALGQIEKQIFSPFTSAHMTQNFLLAAVKLGVIRVPKLNLICDM